MAGFDVWICDQWDGGMHASHYCPCTQVECQDGRVASERHSSMAPAGLEDAGSSSTPVIKWLTTWNMQQCFYIYSVLRSLSSTARTAVPCCQCACTQLSSLSSMMRTFAWRRWERPWRRRLSKLWSPASIWTMTPFTTCSPVGVLLSGDHR